MLKVLLASCSDLPYIISLFWLQTLLAFFHLKSDFFFFLLKL